MAEAESVRLTAAGLAQEVADWFARYVQGRQLGPEIADEAVKELRREVLAAIRLAQLVERERCARLAARAGQDRLAASIRGRRRGKGEPAR